MILKPSKQQPLNELEIDDKWQREIFDRLLRPILKAKAYEGQIVFLDVKSEVAKFLQKWGHL
jgi:hypothetical protein